MKIHVILKEQARKKLEAKSPESLQRYISRMQLHNVQKPERVTRHGVITGEVDGLTDVERLKRKRDVEAVELDTIQSAI